MSMCEQHYSLRWNDYTVKLVTAFQSLRDEEDFLDVTLACDGHQYSAHKMVLSACSPFFRTLLKANPCQHPIVILKDVGHIELERLLEFMYNGEVNIAQDQLAAFLKTAENLKIRGLAGSSDDSEQSITRDASLGNLTSSESLALSGHSSPFATYSAGQGPSSKDCNMSTEGDAYTRTDSPASKKQRKLNSSNMHLEDSISSQNADTLVSESGSEVDPLSVSATSLMCEGESRAERRELKVEPPEGTNDSYGDSMKLGHAHQIGDDPSATYPVAVAGPSGLPMISQDGVGAHEQGAAPFGAACEALNLSLRSPLPSHALKKSSDFSTTLQPPYYRHGYHLIATESEAAPCVRSSDQYVLDIGNHLQVNTIPSQQSHSSQPPTIIVKTSDAVATELIYSESALDLVMQADNIKKETVVEEEHFQPQLTFVDIGNNPSVSSDYKTKAYPCPECHKIFRHPMSLHHHRHVHRGTYTCHSCGKVFSRRWDLHRHLHRSKMGCRRPNHNISVAASSSHIVTPVSRSSVDFSLDLNNSVSN